MDTFTQPKITGYRQLNEQEAELMNEIKAKAAEDKRERRRLKRLALSETPTKEEWIKRCAARFKERVQDCTDSEALALAHLNWDFNAEDNWHWPDSRKNPEDCADSEMSYWGDDE